MERLQRQVKDNLMCDSIVLCQENSRSKHGPLGEGKNITLKLLDSFVISCIVQEQITW